jgi:hypothetical protein
MVGTAIPCCKHRFRRFRLIRELTVVWPVGWRLVLKFQAMAHAAVPVFDGVVDKSYDQASVASMEDDVLALCKHFHVSQDTVTNLYGDDFTTIGKLQLILDPEDREEFLSCAVGKSNKVALRHLLKRLHAGDLRKDVSVVVAPPTKKAKVSPSGADVASGSSKQQAGASSALAAPGDDEDGEGYDEAEPGFEKTEVTIYFCYSFPVLLLR